MNPRSDRTAVARFRRIRRRVPSALAGLARLVNSEEQHNSTGTTLTTPVCLGVGVPTAVAATNAASGSINKTQWETQEQPRCASEWVCQQSWRRPNTSNLGWALHTQPIHTNSRYTALAAVTCNTQYTHNTHNTHTHTTHNTHNTQHTHNTHIHTIHHLQHGQHGRHIQHRQHRQ